MKAIKYILSTVCLIVVFCSCSKEDEVPPYQKTLTSNYVIPAPVPLSSEERAWLNDLRDEYNNAIQGQ